MKKFLAFVMAASMALSLAACVGSTPASVTGADVSRMTRAQREALERKALHGEVITF